MANMHSALADLLEARRTEIERIRLEVSSEQCSEDDGKAAIIRLESEYEANRKRILEDDLGLASETPVGAAPKLTSSGSVTVVSAAEVRKQEAIRIETLRRGARVSSFLPRAAPKPVSVPIGVTETVNGEQIRRILTREERLAAQAAQDAQLRAAEQAAITPTSTGPNLSIPQGFEISKGIIRPANKPVANDPLRDVLRARVRAGEITLEQGRALWLQHQADKPLGAQITCPICKGESVNNKITGKLCRCGGKGAFAVDIKSAEERLARGAYTADPLPVPEDAISYTAYLTDGRRTTVHSDNGTKAIRGACQSLRESGTGFSKVVLDVGVMLVLHHYSCLCPACHGNKITEGRTCTQCIEGRVTKVGGRFFFPGDKMVAGAAATEAGHAAMSSFDATRQCGKKKCKGSECRACVDARQGGFQKPGFVRCGECKGSGKLDGVDHQKCRGKGFFTTTEFYWIDQQSSFSVTDEIRRVDLLVEDQGPKRDRNIAIKLGQDTVLIGAGKVPSRKSGSIMHLTGTAREKYQTAEKVYGRQEIVKGRNGRPGWSHRPNQGVGFLTSVHNDRSTFSDG